MEIDDNPPVGEQIKKDLCEICARHASKYSCPACYLRTCSVDCVKEHKGRFQCDGNAKRVAMVPLEKYDALNLLSDYRFLEEAARVKANCSKTANDLRLYERHNWNQLKKLDIECRRKRIKLQFCPVGLSRCSPNTSTYNPIADTIFWKIKWIFVEVNNYFIETERNPETITLLTLLKQFVRAPREGCEPTSYSDRLKSYTSTDPSLWRCYMRVERNPWTKDRRYYQLDIGKSICDNLRGKTIIEFPVIFVTCQQVDGEDPRFPLLPDSAKTIPAKFESPNFFGHEHRSKFHRRKSNFRKRRGNGRKFQQPSEDHELQIEAQVSCTSETDKQPPSTSPSTSATAAEQEKPQNQQIVKPLRRLLPVQKSYGSGRGRGDFRGGHTMNAFMARRMEKQKAIDDLADALIQEIQGEKAGKQAEQTEEKTCSNGSMSNAKNAVQKTDYFSLLGFNYGSSSDGEIEDGEIRD